jgi:hypothetical protein
MLDINRNRHMLQLVKVVLLQLRLRHVNRRRRSLVRDLRPESIRLRIGRESRNAPGRRGGPPSLRVNEFPPLREVDDRPRIELAEAVLVVVRATGGGHLPVRVIRVDLDGGADAEVLHVAPGEVRTAREGGRVS